ncbi:(2Fe-2S) ferredoxin domain-containing protein [Enterococcus devriesei]
MEDWNELKELRNTYRQTILMRLKDEDASNVDYEKEILVCAGTGCISSKSGEFVAALKEELAKNKLTDQVNIVKTGCFGLCAQGPIVIIYPEGVFYHQVQPKHAKKIVSDHLVKGKLVEKLLYHDNDSKEIINKLMDTPFITSKSEWRCEIVDESIQKKSRNTSPLMVIKL